MKEVEKSSDVPETNGLLKYFDRPLKPDEQEKLDNLLLKAIIRGNLPFSIFQNNPWLQAFVKMLRPSYSIPGNTKIREDLLISLYRTSYLSHQTLIASLTDLTITLDGWTDVGSTSIYVFMATKGPEEFLLSIVDMTSARTLPIRRRAGR